MLTRDTVSKLNEVLQALKNEEDKADFNMAFWARKNWDYSPCGTACCFAGKAALMHGENLQWFREDDTGRTLHLGNGIQEFAIQYFGITYDQSKELFFTGSWCEEANRAYNYATSHQERVAALEIQLIHFIKTHGVEGCQKNEVKE